MNLKFGLFFILTISLCFYSCSGTHSKTAAVTTMGQPEFVDNGKTIDRLKKAYHCKSIDYENWDDKKETDSCLTVCLINSTKVPSMVNPDSRELIEIAATIKKSLAKPQNYKSYYIIFVKKDKFNGEEIKVHSLGQEIRTKDL
jgi:hypothetical protein